MITVENLGICFGETWIFKKLSFQIVAGESAVLIGPSGGGKSVLLKLIAGLLLPTEGRVTLQSTDLGMLFQKNALFDSFTIEENLLFPLKERKSLEGAPARDRAKKMLQAVGLDGTQALYPNEISGGMQKRLGIARALIVEPKIILYDEPTAGLDPITSRTIAELIETLRSQSGSTLLTVTNDVQRAYQLADRIYFLAQGNLSDGGTPTDVQKTTDPALKQFIYGLKQGPLTSSLA